VLGDDFPAIEFGHQLAKGLLFEIEAKDRADRLGLGFIDDELLVLCVIAVATVSGEAPCGLRTRGCYDGSTPCIKQCAAAASTLLI
jgi:hypothetical protein